jgi:hypothetical protein
LKFSLDRNRFAANFLTMHFFAHSSDDIHIAIGLNKNIQTIIQLVQPDFSVLQSTGVGINGGVEPLSV